MILDLSLYVEELLKKTGYDTHTAALQDFEEQL